MSRDYYQEIILLLLVVSIGIQLFALFQSKKAEEEEDYKPSTGLGLDISRFRNTGKKNTGKM